MRSRGSKLSLTLIGCITTHWLTLGLSARSNAAPLTFQAAPKRNAADQQENALPMRRSGRNGHRGRHRWREPHREGCSAIWAGLE
jgi:hypothetical protein